MEGSLYSNHNYFVNCWQCSMYPKLNIIFKTGVNNMLITFDAHFTPDNVTAL